ncbi:MAG TPA: GNAT family N-acetyltransferase [Marinobacter sp.]|nr:GNAT family N-acetyltransferase [Marinobacter sp.]
MSSVQSQDWSRFAQQLARRGQRRLVLVEGQPGWACAWVTAQLRTLSAGSVLWAGRVEDAERACAEPVEAGRYKRWLGQETGVIVWDGWQGNSPDAFAALAGTLKAGGLLFWLMPPLARWGEWDDPDYRRTGLDEVPAHPFAARLASVLAEDEDVLRIREGEGEPALPELQREGTPFRPGATQEQEALVARLVQFGLGRRRRPLVVTADRGRGKSAALGMAAAELVLAGRQQVIVTAPVVDSLQSFFHHAAMVLGAQLQRRSAGLLVLHDGRRIRFVPVPELLAERPGAEVVMVDEAAAIPAHWLQQILTGWPRVAFASTVHGYEGTGRGFAIRFRQVLDRITPHWQAITLNEPVRWAANDPLERLLFRLFLLTASGPGLTDVPSGELAVEAWCPARADDTELTETFGLLVDAHYRTTPADLRQWLDAPGVRCWRARIGGQTAGLLWGVLEGGLDEAVAREVAMGRRRIRGHLLAQSLASHGGLAEAGRQRCLRVVRIAVAEPARGRGVGRALVAAAVAYCQQQAIDTLGTSFGGEAGLLRFWRACGLLLVRIGLSQEASTGEFPLQLLRGVTPAGEALTQRLRRRFARHWQVLIPRHWADLDPDLLGSLAADLPAVHGPEPDDRQDLLGFAEGHRGFELSLPLLVEMAGWPGFMAWLVRQDEAGLWCRVVLQRWSWQRLQALGLVQGKRDGERRLRQLMADWMAHQPEL